MQTRHLDKAILFALLLVSAAALSEAATPPALVNYQGVLRDASDNPLSGVYDMTFRFYDADPGGNLLLTDSHLASGAKAVSVSGGLFNVVLGDGAISGGTEATLADVFRDHASVYLEVTVGAETLSPRLRITASGYALNADHLDGRDSSNFIDTSATAQTKSGKLTVSTGVAGATALEASGGSSAAYFQNLANSSNYANLATSSFGIQAYGSLVGGYFKDQNNTGTAWVGTGDQGIRASGNYAGGYFWDADNSSYSIVGFGDVGIEASGSSLAANFVGDMHVTGNVGIGTTATDRKLDVAGQGRFVSTAVETHGLAVSGYSGLLVSGTGFVSEAGRFVCGQFADDCYGLDVTGGSKGAVIQRQAGVSVQIAAGGGAIVADGPGYFQSGANWAQVPYSTYKIFGNGISTSFVQNHPTERDRVVVYSAPEGDEVAVYTRGSARLIGGEARVRLGPTFKWVTNPDIGLTAHLTPREDCNGLYVASMSTDELVVRESNGGKSDVVFDYLVYGLRIGFEEVSVVQEKTFESFIPSMKDHRDLYARQPEVRSFNALERYKTMQVEAGLPAADSSRADALKAAIHEYDPATDPRPCELLGLAPCEEELAHHRQGQQQTTALEQSVGESPLATESKESVAELSNAATSFASRHPRDVAVPAWQAPVETVFPVSESIEAGDLLSLDPIHAGRFMKATASDTNVVGIAAESSRVDRDGNMSVVPVNGFYAAVNADASYGAIWPGDLLVGSPTPGHAMKAPEVVVPGTVIGKALEPLEAGTGSVRVLVTPK